MSVTTGSKCVLWAGFVSLVFLSPAAAATRTWDGGANGQWTNWTNWSPDGAPVPGADDLVFAGGANLATTNDFPTDSVFGGITFDATAGAFTLGGASRVALPAGVPANSANLAADNGMTTGGGIISTSANTQTVSLPLRLLDGKHIFQTDAGNLNLSGTITRSVGATVVFDPNTGTNINLTGSGLANDPTGILGGWAALGGNEPNGLGNNTTGDWASLDGSGNVVAYTGYTDISAGDVTSNPATNLRYLNDTANLAVADGTELNTILASTGTNNRNITLSGLLRLGSSSPGGASAGIYKTPAGSTAANGTALVVAGGSITAKGGGELNLLDSTNHATWSGFAAQNNNLQLTSTVVVDDGANPVHVNIMGYAVLNAANTYTGGTTITQGRVQAGNANSFGPAGSTVVVYAGGQAFLNANTTFNYNWIVNGMGSQEQNGLGAFRANNNKIIAGTITLQSTSAFGGGNNNSAGAQSVIATISGPGGLVVGHGINNNGSGTVRFGDGTGTQRFTYAGDTTVNLASGFNNTLAINTGSNNLLPHGAGRGNVILTGTAAGAGNLALNGTSQTINALNSAGDTPTNTNVTGNAAGGAAVSGAVLAIGDNNASGSFAGSISTDMSIRKIGSGTQVLSGANTYTANTQVYGGTLQMDQAGFSSTGSVAVTSGAIFNLNFAGENIVNALYFGATAQATGTWGSLASSATHKDARFTGLGLLNVQTLASNLLPGDFDGSKTVDDLDLAKWRTEYGVGGGADADYDGDSDGNDFAIWQRNLGQSIPGVAAAGAVPEPSAAALAALAVCGLAAGRRQR